MTGFDELDPRDRRLAASLQAGLRNKEESLDLNTMARLRAARACAVDAATRSSHRSGWLFASGGFATAAVIALVFILRPSFHLPGSTPDAGPRATKAEAFEVLTDDVDAEFYEDLDLYRWLDRGHDGAA